MGMTLVCSRMSKLEYQLDLASQQVHTMDADSKDVIAVLKEKLDSKDKEVTKTISSNKVLLLLMLNLHRHMATRQGLNIYKFKLCK